MKKEKQLVVKNTNVEKENTEKKEPKDDDDDVKKKEVKDDEVKKKEEKKMNVVVKDMNVKKEKNLVDFVTQKHLDHKNF